MRTVAMCEELVAAADGFDVSTIDISPRPKTKFQQLLSEISSHRLITESQHPVVVFSKNQTEGK